MTSEQPPFYPFPDDEILWHKKQDGFDPNSDSYFALGRLPQPDERVFNGHKHFNPYRLVIRTPVRGSTAMYVNNGDLTNLVALGLKGLAIDDTGMYGPKEIEAVELYRPFWESMAETPITFKDD